MRSMVDRTPADPPEPLAPRRSLRSLELRAALLLVFMAAQWQQSPKGLLPGYASMISRAHAHDD